MEDPKARSRNHGPKQRTRARMSTTGESYQQARRALEAGRETASETVARLGLDRLVVREPVFGPRFRLGEVGVSDESGRALYWHAQERSGALVDATACRAGHFLPALVEQALAQDCEVIVLTGEPADYADLTPSPRFRLHALSSDDFGFETASAAAEDLAGLRPASDDTWAIVVLDVPRPRVDERGVPFWVEPGIVECDAARDEADDDVDLDFHVHYIEQRDTLAALEWIRRYPGECSDPWTSVVDDRTLLINVVTDDLNAGAWRPQRAHGNVLVSLLPDDADPTGRVSLLPGFATAFPDVTPVRIPPGRRGALVRQDNSSRTETVVL